MGFEHKKTDSRPTRQSPSAVPPCGTFPFENARRTMILISVENYNNFSQNYYDSVISGIQLHQLTCTCGCSGCMTVHSYYKRGVVLPDGLYRLRICRVRCRQCGCTHALLLSSIVPYDRISLWDQHKIILAYENGTSPSEVCDENPGIDENNVKAVILRYRLFWLQRLLAEAIHLGDIRSLVHDCTAHYSLQFMQIRRTACLLFSDTT